MAKSKKATAYTVVYEPAGERGWWTVTIPEVRGCISQGRSIAQARERVREALGLFVDDADTVELVDDIRLPEPVRGPIARYREARKVSEAAQEAASKASREAARALVKKLGFSTRDAGEALGISQARVAQLAR